jgi:hypothetical protein
MDDPHFSYITKLKKKNPALPPPSGWISFFKDYCDIDKVGIIQKNNLAKFGLHITT